MTDLFTLTPIGWVRCARAEPVDDDWDAFPATLELDPDLFGREALLDAIDGTPVIDIKPVMSGFQPRGVVAEPDWGREIMRG
jgi:hypothetical protein